MNKNELKKAIEFKIKKLNKIIDHKIINGFSYHVEAQKHLSLLRLLKKYESGWNFSKAMSYVSLFFF